jgi:conjugative transfer pilus assembly protein TraH
MHIDTPSFKSGCGGIDLFAGGFSFINSANITAFFQKIMSDSAGYALNLALETEVPEIAHSMQYIQQIAQKINNSNINSCNMAEDLVGGLWPKTRASQQQICQDIGSRSGGPFTDWADARQKCRTGGDFNTEMNDAANDPRYKNRVIVNKNLVWSAIQQNGFLSEDTQLAELFMSLSGTITYDSNGKATVYYPLAKNRDLIKALLNGGTAQIYICDESKKCLNPNLGNITISKNDSLNQQVITIINEMVSEVQNDSGITDAQKGFLNTVSIPVLKFITASLSLKNGAEALDLTNYSDIIAKKLLEQYMLEALQIVQQSLTSGDYPPEVQKQLDIQIQISLGDVENIKTTSHQDLQDVMVLIQNMRTLERESVTNMSNELKNNLNFSGAEA